MNYIDYENMSAVVFTVEQAAHALKIGKNTAYDLVRSGQIRSVRIGCQIRIPKSALMEFLAA
jgi:excisionase family DNA binding protein